MRYFLKDEVLMVDKYKKCLILLVIRERYEINIIWDVMWF